MAHFDASRRVALRLAQGLGAWLTLGAFGGIERRFAPKAKLWPKWQVHDPASTISVDHNDWRQFLADYLSIDAAGVARVAYGRVTGESRALLRDYIGRLSSTAAAGLNRNEQMALWINLYNAATIDVVLEHYPVATILDIDTSPGLIADGPWDEKRLSMDGERLTLNDIEHRILRPVFGDNRIHFAVNCASVGCPNLAPEPYTATTLEAMLAAATRSYVNHPRGAHLDDDRLTVSKIFDWYADDFGGSEASVLAFIAARAEPPLAAALMARTGSLKVAYDWALNDDPPVLSRASTSRRSR